MSRAGPSGNNPPDLPAAAVNEADVAACAAKADKAKSVAASATGEVAAMLAADPPQSLQGLAFNAPDGKPMTLADRAGKTVLAQSLGDLVLSLPRGDAGARMRCRRKRAATNSR